MVPVAVYDELIVEPANTFSFSCDNGSLCGDDNLVVKAAFAIQSEPAVRIALSKRIPTQAGMGGGSSDAAAVLRAAMNGAFGSILQPDWVAMARSLGSDVPFFLTGSAALVEGTGERVTALGTLPAWHVLVVKPPAAVSTAEAYGELDRIERPSRPRNSSVSLAMIAALQRADFAGVQTLMMNDFHDAIVEKTAEVAHAVDALKAAGAKNALLSGSGSAVFTIAQDRSEIEALGERLDLPDAFARFVSAFAPTPEWRSANR